MLMGVNSDDRFAVNGYIVLLKKPPAYRVCHNPFYIKILRIITPDPSTALRTALDPVSSKEANNYKRILNQVQNDDIQVIEKYLQLYVIL